MAICFSTRSGSGRVWPPRAKAMVMITCTQGTISPVAMPPKAMPGAPCTAPATAKASRLL
ncbi:hypothetical protein ACFFMP_04900 [Pseudoroseomonas cervicalis]|uniref:hypothetical protein n=1 Tax=Teichococcus cervicalis TaxID=204525 RepID=UPI0035E7D76D